MEGRIQHLTDSYGFLEQEKDAMCETYEKRIDQLNSVIQEKEHRIAELLVITGSPESVKVQEMGQILNAIGKGRGKYAKLARECLG